MKTSLETVVAWAKRKGFVYPNSEIYGGLANAWDFGQIGRASCRERVFRAV